MQLIEIKPTEKKKHEKEHRKIYINDINQDNPTLLFIKYPATRIQ